MGSSVTYLFYLCKVAGDDVTINWTVLDTNNSVVRVFNNLDDFEVEPVHDNDGVVSTLKIFRNESFHSPTCIASDGNETIESNSFIFLGTIEGNNS